MGVYGGPNAVEEGLVLALDAGNGKSYSQNEHPNPLDIYGWYVDGRGNDTAGSSTISRDSIYSPVGNTPLRMDVTGNDPQIFSYNSAAWNIAPALNGERWIVSVYVKANVSTTGEILIFGANSSGTAFVNGGWLSLTGITVNIGTEWTRVQHVHTMNNADVAFIHARLDGPPSGGAGQTVWWDGLQVERVPAGVSTPTPFNSFYTGANTIRDLIGSNNGTLTNRPTYNSSNGGSLSFDGVDDYINIPFNASTMDFSLAQTICMWIKPTTGSESARRNPYNQAYGGPGTLTHEPNRTINYYFGTNGGNATPYVGRNSGFTIATNELAFISVTRDQATNVCNWYKNGVLITTADAGGYAATANGTSPILIGDGYVSPFLGNIYDCKVYNRALTPQEIQQNYNATKSRYL